MIIEILEKCKCSVKRRIGPWFAHSSAEGRNHAWLLQGRDVARWNEEFRLVLPGGHIQASSVVEHGLEGKPVRMIGINRDITPQKELEEHLRAAKREADAANQAKSDFLANMSHELRSPMNCILGMTEMVLDTDLTPRQRDYLGKARASSKALLRLLNDILDYTDLGCRGHRCLAGGHRTRGAFRPGGECHPRTPAQGSTRRTQGLPPNPPRARTKAIRRFSEMNIPQEPNIGCADDRKRIIRERCASQTQRILSRCSFPEAS